MQRLFRAAIFGIAALLAVGMVGITYGTATQIPDKTDKLIAKREDTAYALVAASDDDDDDDESGDSRSRNSRDSRSRTGRASRDATNSRHTRVSRDRDHSRGDKTRDRTRDGRGFHRDWKQNYTNDRSRNDTR